jgi:hypothetical protein
VHLSETAPDGEIVSFQSSVVNVVCPKTTVQGWLGLVSPLVPPNFSPSQIVVFLGLVIVFPLQVNDPVIVALLGLRVRVTESSVNPVSTTPQVLSKAAQALGPGAVVGVDVAVAVGVTPKLAVAVGVADLVAVGVMPTLAVAVGVTVTLALALAVAAAAIAPGTGGCGTANSASRTTAEDTVTNKTRFINKPSLQRSKRRIQQKTYPNRPCHTAKLL